MTYGARIAGVGSAAPARVVTNHDLAERMDTSHEWIVQRTGIHRRHMIDQETESELSLATSALQRALDDAGMTGADLDFVIHASVTSEMTCPSNACRMAEAVGTKTAGAFDLVAACSGFVYGMNVADSLIRTGRHRTIGVVGCDALSKVSDYTERTVSILFGDGAGAMVIQRDDDPGLGCLHQEMGGDGSMWRTLYMPRDEKDIPDFDRDNVIKMGCLRMNGREVFKFAVSKFRAVMERALAETGLTVDDISQFVCHQSNARIIESAMQKIGLPADKVHINIDEFGNTSAGSVGLVFDELWRAGKIQRGDTVMCVAFGGGLTWGANVWKL
jgi:3-oxoacyl-[acyl-carrier-protein] synthase-3